MNQEKLQQRLQTLRIEFENGQTELRELQQRQLYLHETMLRIQGAMQVLEEIFSETLQGNDARLHVVDTASQSAK